MNGKGGDPAAPFPRGSCLRSFSGRRLDELRLPWSLISLPPLQYFSYNDGVSTVLEDLTIDGFPNLLELVDATPLEASEMLGIDRGTVFDGGGDLSTPGPSVCTDGVEDGGSDESDVRLKTDIEQVGTTVYGLPLYHFRYKTGTERYEGVMAQDVLEVMPDAVVTGENGFYRVKYGRLGIRMTRA
jgi:hypothetical protein